MMNFENSKKMLTSTEVLQQKKVGKTTIFFTQKALYHILQEHSQQAGTEKAKAKGKICFEGEEDIRAMGNKIVDEMPEYLDRYRQCGSRLTENPRQNLISHLYLPESKDRIVQLKFLKPDTFEIVSFYKQRNLKK